MDKPFYYKNKYFCTLNYLWQLPRYKLMSNENNEYFNVLDDLETPDNHIEVSDVTGIEKSSEDSKPQS